MTFHRYPFALLAWAGMVVALTGCWNAPWWSRDQFTIEGTFEADGRCVAHLDGQRIVSDTVRQQYLHNFAENVPIPEGQDWQIVTCGTLSLSFLAPEKELAAPGRYSAVERRFPTVGTFKALYEPDTRRGTILGAPWPFAYTVHLHGRTGTLEIEGADSARLVGRFRFMARRKAG